MNRKRKAIENVSQRHFRRLKKKYNEYSKVENVISASNLLPIEETQNSAMNSLQQNNYRIGIIRRKQDSAKRNR